MSDDTTTDEELMDRLRNGDDGALNLLMTRWELPIRRYLSRLMWSEVDALDAAQEVFVRVYQHRDRFTPGGHFKAWLFAIATNLARSRYRWWKRHPTEALPDENEGGGAVPAGLREESTPANSLGKQEEFATVRRAVASLPENLRTVTLLFEFEELSHREIATALHCSAKAVENRLYRARAHLRAALAPIFDNRTAETMGAGDDSAHEPAAPHL